MACGYGLLAQDCAADHWCGQLNGRREVSDWRAPCPVCRAPRALEFDVRGRTIRWNSFCGQHDREVLRPVLKRLLRECMPGRPQWVPPDRGILTGLALSGLPPVALRVALLNLAGMTLDEAMDKLGVERANRYRVRRQMCQHGYKPAGQL